MKIFIILMILGFFGSAWGQEDQKDSHWISCVKEDDYCYEINLNNISFIKRRADKITFYRLSDTHLTCDISELRKGRHCHLPEIY